jgi:hypothetical protein
LQGSGLRRKGLAIEVWRMQSLRKAADFEPAN